MHLYINLKTFPIAKLEDVIKQYYTSNLIFNYNDESSFKELLRIYNSLKKKSIVNLICEDSSINVFLYNNPNIEGNHIVNIFPKDFNVYNNIANTLKKINSKWLIVNNIFNLSRDYDHLITYLQNTEKPIYYVHGLDDEAITNYKKLIEYTRNMKKPLSKPTNLYGFYDMYEIIFTDRIYFKNINTSKLEYIPVEVHPITNDKYLMTQINNPNYEEFVQHKEKYINIYQELYKLYFNSKILK